MNRGLLIAVLVISFLVNLVGVISIMIHSELARSLVALGLFTTISFLFLFISDVRKSTYVRSDDKFKWIVKFIFLIQIAGLFYLIKYRKMQTNS